MNNDIELTFPDAMREVLNGKKVRRLSWNAISTWGELHDGYLCLFIRGEYNRWIVNDGDMTAIDWVALQE